MKAKKLLLTLMVSLAATISQSQNGWVWLKQFTQAPNPNLANELDISQIRYAKSGNIYVLGSYKSHFILDGNTYNGYPDQSSTKLDIFLAKLNAAGYVVWVITMGGNQGDNPDDMAIDNQENIYVSGFFQGTCDFGSGNTLTSSGGNDGFIVKYDSTGTFQWVRKAAYGTANERVSAITIGKDGNLYVAGMSQSSSFTIGDGTNEQSYTNADGNRDLFLASFTPSGMYRWSRQIPGNSNTSLFRAIAVDETNNLYVGGALGSTLTIDGSPYTSVGAGDIILVKASPTDGSAIWVRKGGSTLDDQLNSIAVYENFAYLIGYIQGTGTIDSTATQQSSQFTTAGYNDIFLAKYNLDGRLIWKKTIGSTGGDVGYGLNVYNNILVATGYFSNSIDFNLNTIISGGSNDAAFFVFDVESNAVLAKSVSGTLDDRGQGVALDTLYNVYLGGYFTSPTLTVGTNTLTNSGSEYKDLFLAKNHINFTTTFTYKKNISCYGGSDGALTVTPYFGTPPYSYSWKLNGNPYAASDSSITNLAAGTYEVTVTDNKSEQSTLSYTLTEPTALSINYSVTNVSCYGYNDGAIDITVSGGTPPYSYFWTTENGGGHVIDAEDQSTLSAGDYQLQVTDANGCQITDNYTISQPSQIVITGTVTNITGAGSNGAVDITVSGGSGTYSNYSWKLGETEVATTEDISGLDVGGTYKVIVTDNTSCKDSNSFVVLDERNFHAWVSAQTNVSCKGESTGEVTVSYAENTGTVTVLWSSGETTFTITGKPAGSYTATLTDDNGTPDDPSDDKVVVVDVDITEPAQILDGTIVSYPTSCYGGSDGILDLTPSGGTGPYSYSWNTTPVHTTQDLNNLSAGTYQVTITDQNGCTAIKTAEVTQPDDISFSFIATEPTCYNSYTGELSVNNLTGGTAPYNYLWSNTLTTPTISNIKGGSYWLKVTDSKGCNKTYSTYLSQPSDIIISHSENKPTCPESKNGSIGLTVNGGTPGYTYFWTGPDIVNATDKDQVNLGPGTYTVTVTDANLCTKEYQVVLTSANPTPTVTLTTNHADNSICQGTEVIFTAGGGSTYEFFLNGSSVQGPGIAYAYSNSSLINGDQVFAEVTSAAGCKATTSTITITVFTLPTVTAHASANPICEGDGVTLTGGGAVSYTWDKGVIDGQVFYPSETDTYTVIGTDANGCQNSAQITVTVNPVPNAVMSTTDPLEYCADQTVSTLFSASPSDGSFYQWIKDGQNISGAHTNTYTATEPGFYSVYLIKNGCWSISDEVQIVVHPLPSVTLADFNAICVDATPISLNGGSPEGGVYSGNGVTGTTFDPAAAGVGTHTITYTYTDGNGCVSSDSKDITVNPLPTANISTTDPTIWCEGTPINVTLTAETADSYQWLLNGNPIPGETNPTLSVSAAGTYSLSATTNGCTAIGNSIEVSVISVPAVTIETTDALNWCEGDEVSVLLHANPSDGSAYQWRKDGNDIDQATQPDYLATDAGIYSVLATFAGGCQTTSDELTITINPLPVVDLPNDTIRIDTTQQYTLDAGPGFSTYLWNDQTTEQTLLVDGYVLGEGIFKFWVTVTNEFGCSASDTAVVIIGLPNSLPTDKLYSINIYPNPTTGNFNIKIVGFDPGKYSLEFYNAIGNKVRTKEITIKDSETDITVNIERLPKGLYYIRFGTSNKYLIRKLILE